MSGATLSAGELWLLIIVLSGTAYGLKVLGFVVVGGRTMPPVLNRCLALIPASLLAALVAKDTFTTAQELVLDARAVGLVVAIVAVWRKAPFIVVVVAAMAATALVRALA
ncbi:MAG: AzlD domain-containing protein [Ilumatobacteraceae bacterium]